MREICTSGSMSGEWKRSMAELVRHRQTKEPETDRLRLNHRATPRLYFYDRIQAPGGSRGTPGARTIPRAMQIRERPTARCPRASARGFLSTFTRNTTSCRSSAIQARSASKGKRVALRVGTRIPLACASGVRREWCVLSRGCKTRTWRWLSARKQSKSIGR